MTGHSPGLQASYKAALAEYLRDDSEEALLKAYEIGRQAVLESGGIIPLLSLHQEAMMGVFAGGPDVRSEQKGTEFLINCISPFEMTQRGYHDAIRSLKEEVAERRRAEAELRMSRDLLERTVLERTAELSRTNDLLLAEIREHDRVNAMLRERTVFLKKLFDNAGAPVITWDPDLRITSFNRGAERLFARKAGEVIGMEVGLLFPAQSRSVSVAVVREATGGPDLDTVEIPVETSERRVRVVLWNSANIYSEDKETLVVTIAQGTDITERKQAERELIKARLELEDTVGERTRELRFANEHLRELDRLKSMFIASMSHELRTPLNSIIGFTGILVKGLAGDLNEEQTRQLLMVQDSARHLLALINDVIDISKVEADKVELTITTFDLAAVLSQVCREFGSAASLQDLALRLDVNGPVLLQSDERRVRQIVSNLVGNAIKFTDTGSVTVRAGRENGTVRVTVTDTGIGIRHQDLSVLFTPFNRVLTPGRLTEGTGLGLYLSRKLARLLGGDIRARSVPGKGSAFTFVLPRQVAGRGTAVPGPETARPDRCGFPGVQTGPDQQVYRP